MKTREENEQIIREACIEANPEIMELKFGCEVKTGDYNPETGMYICHFFKASYIKFPRYDVPQALNDSEHKLEIIGRPIRLADVLLTISWYGKEKNVTYFPGTNVADFIIKIRDVAYRPNDGGCIWYLKGDLHDQSDDTLSFLAGLLSDL